MSPTAGPRVAAIGLDAMEWTLAESMVAAGELPNLARLRDRSAVAMLHDRDYRTGLVWEHFVSGSGAGGPNRSSAVEFDPATYEVWQDGARAVEPFFRTTPPLEAVIFDVPYVNLGAHGVDGVLVTDFGAHDPAYPRASIPQGLLTEIDERFGPHPACQNCYGVVWHRPAALDCFVDGLVSGCARRAEATTWLLDRFPDWSLFVTVMSETHSAGEQLWHGIDPSHRLSAAPTAEHAGRRLREVYRAVDVCLGRVLDALPDEATVVVFSMHGMQANDADVASMVLLPELLYRFEFGAPLLVTDHDADRWLAAGCPPLVPGEAENWTSMLRRRFDRPAHEGLARRARRALRDRAPDPLVTAYRRFRGVRGSRTPAEGSRLGAQGLVIPEEDRRPPDEIGVPRSSVEWQVAARYRQWWPRMRAFAVPTFYDGRVRLNVAGRERDGIVAAADYDEVCRELEERLRACVNPRTGEPAVAEVTRLRTGDPLAPSGPEADLQVVWAEDLDALAHPEIDGVIGPFPYRRMGGHSERGFAMVSGPGVEAGEIGWRSALDVVPTILAFLDRTPPGPVEGKPLLAPAPAV